jgi:ribosomal protein L7/L12
MTLYLTLAAAAVLALVLFTKMRSNERVRMPDGAVVGALDSVESAIHAGRKIDAIKLYREAHHVGLKEAKEAVERLQESMRSR